ncbi:unnamed protein product [Arctogadus glacialis]
MNSGGKKPSSPASLRNSNERKPCCPTKQTWRWSSPNKSPLSVRPSKIQSFGTPPAHGLLPPLHPARCGPSWIPDGGSGGCSQADVPGGQLGFIPADDNNRGCRLTIICLCDPHSSYDCLPSGASSANAWSNCLPSQADACSGGSTNGYHLPAITTPPSLPAAQVGDRPASQRLQLSGPSAPPVCI